MSNITTPNAQTATTVATVIAELHALQWLIDACAQDGTPHAAEKAMHLAGIIVQRAGRQLDDLVETLGPAGRSGYFDHRAG